VLKTIRFDYENGCLKENLKMSRRIIFWSPDLFGHTSWLQAF